VIYDFFFFQAEDGIRDDLETGVQTCALPIYAGPQHTFVLPTGLLEPRGGNTLAIAVWSADTAGGLGQVELVALGNHRGGVRPARSEERRVGKEWRSGRAVYDVNDTADTA